MIRMSNCAAALATLLIAVAFAPPVVALTGETGVDRFGGCLAAQKSGQILVMIDESGSLKDTDPQDNRVSAAKYLAQQLTQFSADAGITLDVAIGVMALYVARDTARRAEPVYLRPDWLTMAYAAVALLAVVGIVVSALGVAFWVGRL